MITVLNIFAIVCAAVGLIGGGLGFAAWLDLRQKRFFIDYINRRLSERRHDA